MTTYYNYFDTDRDQLAGVYVSVCHPLAALISHDMHCEQRDGSYYTTEDKNAQGVNDVMGCLSSVPQVQHNLITLDVQPLTDNSTVVLVTGQVKIEDNEYPLAFAEAFVLVSDDSGMWIANDIFKLNYG